MVQTISSATRPGTSSGIPWPTPSRTTSPTVPASAWRSSTARIGQRIWCSRRQPARRTRSVAAFMPSTPSGSDRCCTTWASATTSTMARHHRAGQMFRTGLRSRTGPGPAWSARGSALPSAAHGGYGGSGPEGWRHGKRSCSRRCCWNAWSRKPGCSETPSRAASRPRRCRVWSGMRGPWLRMWVRCIDGPPTSSRVDWRPTSVAARRLLAHRGERRPAGRLVG